MNDDGLDELRERHPDWIIGATWVVRRSAGDVRRFYAERHGVTLVAFSEAALARQIREAEASARS
jgi:hypothetical protein